jgi:FkbM family methyltransferase
VKTAARQLALRAGVFDPLRTAYQAVFNRDYRELLLERRRLFEPFVPPQSLVFDIGANNGEYSVVLRQLGAKVVAVEPNPSLAERLRRRFRDVEVVEAAVAETPGRTQLFLGADTNYSTISEEWKPVVESRNRLSGAEVSVEVTSFDELIERYGEPAFAKVDVEGKERDVFSGLSHPVAALVFEFQCPLIGDFDACIGRLDSLGAYEYGLEHENVITWTDAEGIVSRVHGLCEAGAGSGDVFARRLA